MKLWKRKDTGVFYVVDKGKMRSLGTRDKKVAERAFRELERQRREKGIVDLNPDKRKWDDFVTTYNKSRTNLADATIKADRLSLDHFRNWMGSDFTMSRINAQCLDKYRGWLHGRFKNPNTCNVYIRSLKTALRHAVRWGWLTANLENFRQFRVEQRQWQFMTPEEVRRMLDASAKVPHMNIALPVMIYCGISRAEIMGQIHYDGATIRYKRQKTGRMVSVPVSSHLAPYLVSLKPGLQRLVPWADPRTFSYKFAKVCMLAGVKTTPHEVRRTFATLALKAGVDLATISDVLGHQDVSVTKRFYMHVLDDVKRKSLELVRF